MIRIAEPAVEGSMKQRLIRYRTKPESADQNAELIADVFRQLDAENPGGVRYPLDDDSFVHIVETEADDGTSALPGLAAFKTFQSGIRERCAEPPMVKNVTIVGNYRMLSES